MTARSLDVDVTDVFDIALDVLRREDALRAGPLVATSDLQERFRFLDELEAMLAGELDAENVPDELDDLAHDGRAA